MLVLAAVAEDAAPARAEPAHAAPASQSPPRLAILAGLGVREAWLSRDGGYPPTQTQTIGALAATVAYRVSDHFAIGVHANAARSRDHEDFFGNTTEEHERSSVLAVDLSIVALYETGRFAVGPWLGRHLSRLHEDTELCVVRTQRRCTRSSVTEWTSDFTSYGLIASVAPDPSLPVAVFLLLQTGTGGARLLPGGSGYGYEYSAASLGIAYRR